MVSKSSHLNLFGSDDTSVKTLDIDSSTTVNAFTGSKIQFAPVVEILHGSGNISDLGQDIADVKQSIIDGNAGSAASSAFVQTNLDNHISGAFSTLSASVTANEGIMNANHTSDATARATLDTTLRGLITAEETARTAADATHTASIAQEVTDRTAAVTALTSTVSSNDTARVSEIAVERARLDTLLAVNGRVHLTGMTNSALDGSYEKVDFGRRAVSGLLDQVTDATLGIYRKDKSGGYYYIHEQGGEWKVSESTVDVTTLDHGDTWSIVSNVEIIGFVATHSNQADGTGTYGPNVSFAKVASYGLAPSLDTMIEIITAYQNADSSTLTSVSANATNIAALTVSLAALQSQVEALTDP